MNIKRMTRAALLIGLCATAALAGRKKAIPEEAIAKAHELLKESATYVAHAPYSSSIPHLFIGYSADGKPEPGIALRGFKTYKWVTAMIVVKWDGDNLVVSDALIPDIARIKKTDKQNKVLAALTAIKSRIIHTPADGHQTIDAVSGATRYNKRIYLYYNRMSEALIKEMTKPAPETRTATKEL
jgi:hypothetical protein